MSTPRVVFVNRFAWPDQPATALLLGDLTDALAAVGESVTVLARRAPGTLNRQTRNGVQLVRIPSTHWGKTSLFGRTVDFLVFIAKMRRVLRAELHAGDILVSMTDPPMLGAATDSVARLCGARRVHWIQDIFPEVASAVSGNWVPQLFARKRDQVWRHADACIVPGQDMAEFVRSRGVRSERVMLCENWAPAGLTEVDSSVWRRQHELSGKFVVMYSGNLGRVHDFSAIIPLASALASDSRIVFAIVGGGARLDSLAREARRRNLTNIRFCPAQPLERLAETLSAGDIHLVTLKPGCERLVFPSKLYGIAAVGRRVVVIGPKANEPERIVSWFGFGAGFRPHEVERLADYFREAASNEEARIRLGRAARDFSRQRSLLKHALPIWQSLLQSLKPLSPTLGEPSGFPRNA